MADIPTPVRPGDPVRASNFNAIVDQLTESPIVPGSPGLSASWGAGAARGGLALALRVLTRDALILCRITARSVEDVIGGPTPGVDPDDLNYDIRSIWRGFTDEGLTPDYGRPVSNGEFRIHPAAVDDLCIIIRVPAGNGASEAKLWILSETIAGRRCTPH